MINESNNVLNIRCRGRITSLWKEQVRTDYLVQGICQKNQPTIEQMHNVRGGNGSYRVLGEYLGTALFVNAAVYDPPVFTLGNFQFQIPSHFRIECYEATRQAIGEKVFGNLGITEKRIDELKKLMVGTKCDINFFVPLQSNKEDFLRLFVLLPFKVNDSTPFFSELLAYKVK